MTCQLRVYRSHDAILYCIRIIKCNDSSETFNQSQVTPREKMHHVRVDHSHQDHKENAAPRDPMSASQHKIST